MITIYHGIRPWFPVLACCRHLGIKSDTERLKGWNWRIQPLRFIGYDQNGGAVCCLVHGRYQELYKRALQGIAAIFGLAVSWVDIEYLLCRQSRNRFLTYVGLPLARYMPSLCGGWLHKPINELVDAYLLIQQEGQI